MGIFRWTFVLGLVGCGSDGGGGDEGLDPPTCQPDSILRYVHDLGGSEVSGELPPGNYGFVNKFGEEPGSLEVGDIGGMNGGDRVRVEFDRSVANGQTVDAGGFFQIGALSAGNCETERPSRFTALDDGWTFTLVELHDAPYCEGATKTGSFAACLIPEPF